MNTITPDQKKEKLVQDIMAIQREEIKITMQEWKAKGMNRKRLREVEREFMRRAEADTRRLVNEMYA